VGSTGDEASAGGAWPSRIEARLASETWLAEARRLAHVGSWQWDPARDAFEFSVEMYWIFGIDPAAAARGADDSLWPHLHPEDAARTRAALEQATADGRPFVHEHRILRPDGRVRMLHSRGQLIESEGGRRRRVVGTCWDITELWETASWPERSISLLRATLEATADGILVVDRTGQIVTYNQRFLELWRIPPDLAERSDNQTLIAFVSRQLVDPELFVRTTRDNQAHPEREYFLSVRFKDGRVLERFSRPQVVGSEIVGRVLTFRDVSEREQLLGKAQEAVRLRDEFLSIAAHEIRGPITSMRLAVQGIRTGVFQAQQLASALEIVDRSQRRLGEFVDKLLDLGRIRTGMLQLEWRPVDLAELAREVVARHAAELSSGTTLHLEAPAPVPGRWDRFRLDQVLTNLLSNAVKFGAGKPVEIQVNAASGRARLVVRDHGIGIPEDVQQRIFRPFERGVSLRNYGGLGLGLHIARTIVRGMNGELSVDSAPGAGATFTVDLPQEAPS
jgi:PAS domain S-box-containing protein